MLDGRYPGLQVSVSDFKMTFLILYGRYSQAEHTPADPTSAVSTIDRSEFLTKGADLIVRMKPQLVKERLKRGDLVVLGSIFHRKFISAVLVISGRAICLFSHIVGFCRVPFNFLILYTVACRLLCLHLFVFSSCFVVLFWFSIRHWAMVRCIYGLWAFAFKAAKYVSRCLCKTSRWGRSVSVWYCTTL